MKAGRCCATALVLAILLAGCRSDPNRELLERELRLQEDKIYQLQGHVNDMAASLEACRRENELLKRELGTGEAGGSGRAEELPSPTRPAEERPGRRPSTSAPPAGPLQPPDVSPGVEIDPGLEGGPTIEVRPGEEGGSEIEIGPDDQTQLQFDGSDEREKARLLPASRTMIEGDSTAVDEIVLLPRLTGGYDADGHPGDEGITVLIQPRDAEDRIIKAPADISVVLIDPLGPSGGSRLARWDFRTDEVVHHFQSNFIGQGIYLQLLWPEERPAVGRVRLFVRYQTADGRKLEASQDIEIAGGDQTVRSPDPIRSAMRHEPVGGSPQPGSTGRPTWKPFR